MISTFRSQSLFIQGIILALLGAVCFSTKAIFVKLAYRDTSIDAITLLALRMIFSLPFFVISAALTSRKSDNIKFTRRQWVQVMVVGCLGYYVSSLLDFKGLQFVSAGIERLILFMYPTMVLVMSSLIFKSKIKPVQWLALGITYVGLLIAFVSEAQLGEASRAGFIEGSIYIFICAITYACYIVGSGRLIPVVGASKFNSYAMSFASAGVFAHFLVVGGSSLLHQENLVYVYSFLMAILSTVIPSYLVTEGIKRIGSGNAAIVGSVGPVSTILMAYFFLSESISFLQLVGTICIILGVLLIGSKGDSAKETA